MKKKRRWILWIVVAVLCFPVGAQYKDGGTVEHTAVLYRIVHAHTLESYNVRGEFLKTEGFYVGIPGLPVYDVYDGRLLTKWNGDKAETLPTLPRGKAGVLYMLDDGGTLHTYTSGDRPEGLAITLRLCWRTNGCELFVQDPAEEAYAIFTLAVGEDVTLWLGDMEAPRAYRFYYAVEDAPLPSSWNDAAAQDQRAAAARAAYGTLGAFAAARDKAAELETIRALLPEKVREKAEDWYDMLLNALWVNGDLSVTFVDAYRDDQIPDWMEVVLLDDDGRAYRLQGSEYFGYIRALFCDEKLYYGLPH